MLLSLLFSLFWGFVPSQPIQPSIQDCVAPAEVPSDWNTWLQDESRLSWWKLNGWVKLDELKSDMPLWTGSDPIQGTVDPFICGMQPDPQKSMQWAFSNGTGIHLHGLERCEVLYQRFLINQSAEAKRIKQ